MAGWRAGGLAGGALRQVSTGHLVDGAPYSARPTADGAVYPQAWPKK
jgi:hypothetical protein